MATRQRANMYLQIFIVGVVFFILWGYIYKYKKKSKLFLIVSFTYISVVVLYILISNYRTHRIVSLFESIFS